MSVQSCYCIIKAGEMECHVTKCYDTTKNLRIFGRVATVYVAMEMSRLSAKGWQMAGAVF